MLINFFGKRGSGKTTAIRGQLNDCRGPVVVLDVLGNFANPEYIQTKDASDGILKIAYYLENPKTQKIIVVQCSDPDLCLDYICAALWDIGAGTLVLDEVDAFSPYGAPCFDQVIRYGRNRNLDLITGCRRPAEISRNITAGANQIFAFQTQEPRDIDYFKTTLFGERAEQLIIMPKFHGLFIDYDRDLVGTFKIDVEGRIYKLKTLSSSKQTKEFENQPSQGEVDER